MTRSLAILAAVLALTACHTDPFSVKPEVRGVTLPDKEAPAEETKEPTEKEKKDAPET